MNADLARLLRGWALSMPDGPELQRIQSQVEYLCDELYEEYEPTRGAHPDFWERLDKWLKNITDDDEKKTLFRLIPFIFFLGPREMECLYKASFQHHILSWIVESISTPLHDPGLNQVIDVETSKTWFCPITDSMRINAFYHYNSIIGRDFRPDWRSLACFGDVTKIEDYITKEGIKRLVLLEDFVGSGSQMFHAVRFAANLPSRLPVLVIPLIMSPRAEPVVALLKKRYTNVEVRPVLKLSPSTLIKRVPDPEEIPLAAAVRALAVRMEPQMTVGLSPSALAKWYGPFGFDRSGALLVMYTNCPDNALPMIHHVAPQWNPLFPRSSRL